jgi:hypothetical protein
MRNRTTLWLGFVSLTLALAVAACGGGAPAGGGSPGATAIEVWGDHHPDASRELAEWVKEHPDAARIFFEWDGHHTERAHEFVTWTIGHPEAGIDNFVASHLGWEYFDKIVESHKPAAEAFMGWARKHGPAAEALMSHPRGLEWAGHHLYKDYWEMKEH